MAEPRMNELAQELLRRSRERKVPWEEKTRRGGYQVIFPDGALILRHTDPAFSGKAPGDPQAMNEYRLELLSDTGSIIDSLEPKPDEGIYRALAEIWDLAEGYVRERGISKALDFLKSR